MFVNPAGEKKPLMSSQPNERNPPGNKIHLQASKWECCVYGPSLKGLRILLWEIITLISKGKLLVFKQDWWCIQRILSHFLLRSGSLGMLRDRNLSWLDLWSDPVLPFLCFNRNFNIEILLLS